MWREFFDMILGYPEQPMTRRCCQKPVDNYISSEIHDYYKFKVDGKYLDVLSRCLRAPRVPLTDEDIFWVSCIHYGIAYPTYDGIISSLEHKFLTEKFIPFSIVHQLQTVTWTEDPV